MEWYSLEASVSAREWRGPDDAAAVRGWGRFGWALTCVEHSAGSRWSVRPAASPVPLAIISPTQVFGQIDPKPMQGGQAAVALEPLHPLVPPLWRGAGVPSWGSPRSIVWKQPSELDNVSLCTSQPDIQGAGVCPAQWHPSLPSLQMGQHGSSLAPPLPDSNAECCGCRLRASGMVQLCEGFVTHCLHKRQAEGEGG